MAARRQGRWPGTRLLEIPDDSSERKAGAVLC